ncbi:fimbria/pilus outer membrane usher protein [Citrobacter sp.]|uniref:fimbria/pilus outer membrane usher protein n=1 Tax=Citrobacter sp. TaxID=1896336 RepID=UPI002FCA8A7E
MDMLIGDRFRLSRIASAFILLNIIGAADAAETEIIARDSLSTASSVENPNEQLKENEESEATGSEDEEVEFSNIFLSNQPIDVSRFAKGNPVTAGKHNVSVVLNEREMGKFDVQFNDNPQDPLRAIPCMSQKELVNIGVDIGAINVSGIDAESCIPLKTLIPQASWKMDINEQRFILTVPQAMLLMKQPDEVPDTLWDGGINAAFLSYNTSYYQSSYDGGTSDSGWVGVDGGLNLLGWRIRVRGDANYSKESGSTFDSSNLYVEHDIAPLKSQLRLGEIYSSSTFFDAFPLRGVTLSSDMRMLPDSLSTFRPVIRGVAESNAKVIVSQAGTKILETTVPPGAFSIDSYNPVSSSEQLDVTIQEVDGRIRQFVIPYNGGGQLLYPGVSLYTLAVGEYNGSSGKEKPLVGQGTWQYGLNNYLSLYTGAEYMTDFYSVIGGVALNTPMGAFSLDLTQSHLSAEDGSRKGQSVGVKYNSFISSTNTSFNIAAYRYSTKNFYTLGEAVDQLSETDWREMDDRLKSQVQFNVSQSLTDGWGSFYSSAMLSEYWRSGRKDKSYQLGYSNSLGRVSYSVSVNRYYTSNNEKDDQVYLSLSVPLGDRSGDKAPLFDYLNTSYTRSSKGDSSLSTSTSGYDQAAGLNYGINANYRQNGYDGNKIKNIGANASWDTRYGSWGANISADTESSRQMSVNGSGGILLHKGGVTFGRTINGDTPVALIEAKGAKGALAMGDNAARINNAGYAYVSNLSPYRFNDVSIDPSKMEQDTELKETSTKVVPRAGAIIYVPFATDDRRSVFFRLNLKNGKNIPLGAEIFNGSNEVVGTVGQSSRAFTRGIEQSGTLSVIWGDEPDEQCRFNYQLPDMSQENINSKTLSVDNVVCG